MKKSWFEPSIVVGLAIVAVSALQYYAFKKQKKELIESGRSNEFNRQTYNELGGKIDLASDNITMGVVVALVGGAGVLLSKN